VQPCAPTSTHISAAARTAVPVGGRGRPVACPNTPVAGKFDAGEGMRVLHFLKPVDSLGGGMFATFKARAEAVSAEVHRFAGRDEALEFIVAVMQKAGVSDAPGAGAVWADGPILASADRLGLAKRVPGLSFDVTKDRAAAARVGVSQADWAIANTGTLAQAVDDVEQRLVATLTNVHVAVVPSSRVVADLGKLLAVLPPSKSNYVTFVTGPSRTADIERVLTIGVHGPERLVIVAIDDLQARN
jgi:L-lactate dehydrogenase complex protein LldG